MAKAWREENGVAAWRRRNGAGGGKQRRRRASAKKKTRAAGRRRGIGVAYRAAARCAAGMRSAASANAAAKWRKIKHQCRWREIEKSENNVASKRSNNGEMAAWRRMK
jgi:hypothetical protein